MKKWFIFIILILGLGWGLIKVFEIKVSDLRPDKDCLVYRSEYIKRVNGYSKRFNNIFCWAKPPDKR